MSDESIISLLQDAGIRPTKIRRALAALLFDGKDKHVTVEDVTLLAREAEIRTSIASVYNTLNQFAVSGLLKKIIVDAGPVFFDTNTRQHYHIFYEDAGRLQDIDADAVTISGLPSIPRQKKVSAIDLTIRVKD